MRGVPEILKQSSQKLFSKTNETLRKAADACYATISDIPSLTCPHKPEGDKPQVQTPMHLQLTGIFSCFHTIGYTSVNSFYLHEFQVRFIHGCVVCLLYRYG